MSVCAMLRRGVTAVVLGATAAGAQGGTDIWLVPVSMTDGKPQLGTPVNVTSRPGYDNQPSFTPDGRSLLYTSNRGDGQTDIYRYDLSTRETVRATSTAPESEYSATVMPGGTRFSVIRVEADSTQRLWSFALDGTDPHPVLAEVKPVGYHAWVDSARVAVFVLGSPATLELVDVASGKRSVVARDIGRSLLPLHGGRGFSFVQQGDSTPRLIAVDVTGDGLVAGIRPVAPMPVRGDYVAWIAPDRLLAAQGTKILLWEGAGPWAEVADLSAHGVGAVTRLALSPDGSMLAVVANEPRGGGGARR